MSKKRKTINEFKGEYFFLSNFYSAPVTFEGITYLNNEAAFQSMKTLDLEERKSFANLDPSSAKRKGRRVLLRSDWEYVKYYIMRDICIAKFEQNPDLKQKLLDTGDAYLEEGNNWNDRVWGTVNGAGRNYLGQILMRVREGLKD